MLPVVDKSYFFGVAFPGIPHLVKNERDVGQPSFVANPDRA
jgi:hypothetical protein